MTRSDEQDLETIYRRYNQLCNAHRFERLGEFVAPEWDLRHLFVSGAWVSAHFLDTGTHRGTFLGVPATGRKVSTQEFAIYRFEAGRIAEVWVTADNLRLLDQLR